jgi:hypothetical protein
VKRLEFLQWFGFLVGGTTWFAVFLAGAGTSQAVCNPASGRWGIPHDTVEASLMAFGAAAVLAAEIASILVYRAVRRAEEQGPPPEARLKFFAVASMAGNLVFLMIILLTGIATIVDRTCHQA